MSLDALAHHIAYSAARCDIECYCQGHYLAAGGAPWFDLDHIDETDPDTRADVARATDYLHQRGKLIHHPEHPRWVRFHPNDAEVATHNLDLGPWPFDRLGLNLGMTS